VSKILRLRRLVVTATKLNMSDFHAFVKRIAGRL